MKLEILYPNYRELLKADKIMARKFIIQPKNSPRKTPAYIEGIIIAERKKQDMEEKE